MKENNSCIDKQDKRLGEIFKFFFFKFIEIVKTIKIEVIAHKYKE